MFSRLLILGVPVDAVGLTEAIAWVEHRIRTAAAPAAIVDLNPEKVCLSRGCGKYRSTFDTAGVILADGVGVTVAARLLHGARIPRLPGIDLMLALCGVAAARGWRVFLYGGTEAVNARAAAKLQTCCRGIVIAGRAHGFAAIGDSRVIEQVNTARPDLLFVGLGSPRQELWIADNLDRLHVPVCQAVGGAFDVLAGRVRRAPRALRAVGLEWLWRLICEPSRFRRQASLIRFAWRVLTVALVPSHREIQSRSPRA